MPATVAEYSIRCRPSAGRRFLLFACGISLLSLLIGALILQNPELMWGAMLPGTLLSGLLFVKPLNMNARLTGVEIEFDESRDPIPYSQIHGLLLAGVCQNPEKKLRKGSITLFHSGGDAVFPASVELGSELLYTELLGRTPLPEHAPQNRQLTAFFDEQTALFSESRVWAFNARSHVSTGTPGKRLRLVWGCLILLGIAWMIHSGARRELTFWLPLGIVLVIVSSVAFLASFLHGVSSGFGIKNWKESGLVISPGGLALVQGPQKGLLKWEELLSVAFGQTSGFRLSGKIPWTRAIRLTVSGAEIQIVDIYNRPLAQIYQQIVGYWQRPKGS